MRLRVFFQMSCLRVFHNHPSSSRSLVESICAVCVFLVQCTAWHEAEGRQEGLEKRPDRLLGCECYRASVLYGFGAVSLSVISDL